MSKLQQAALRSLPSVHHILNDQRLQGYILQYSRSRVTATIQHTLSQIRIEYRQHDRPQTHTQAEIVDRVIEALHEWQALQLKPVINLTGIVLHTNLGRAVLSDHAVQAIQSMAAHYSTLEYDLQRGQRGSRHDYVEELLCQLTGAEAAMVVNNNAAAVWLILRELAHEQEVIVSRGQLVEIGGSFRVSEIMAESGAQLCEVGTTNKTRLSDYKHAISEQTALLMKVHTSNFALIGFHESVRREEMAKLAHAHHVPLFEDLGSGMIYDLKQHGIDDEPTVNESLKAGSDVVSFSGDKLLGGPQAGLIVGRKHLVDRLKQNQMARTMRIDKLSLAGLGATLETYLDPRRAAREIPVLRAILMDPMAIKQRATQLAERITERFDDRLSVSVQQTVAEVGGGSLPGVTLPSYAVRLCLRNGGIHQLEQALRQVNRPVIGRLTDGTLWWDPRTLQPGDQEQVVDGLGEALRYF